MNRIFTALLIGTVILLLFSYCSKESDCDNHLTGSIASIEHAGTIKANATFIYHLQVIGFSNCSSVESIVGKQTGNSIIVTATIYNKGCKCNQSLPTFNANYAFKPDTSGTYVLNFVNDLHGKYLTDTVIVN